MIKLFVGNFPFSTTEADLEELFNQYGAVASVKIITDRESGRSRGFGFVEFDDNNEGQDAQGALHGSDFNGRELRVNEARPQERRSGPPFRNGGTSY